MIAQDKLIQYAVGAWAGATDLIVKEPLLRDAKGNMIKLQPCDPIHRSIIFSLRFKHRIDMFPSTWRDNDSGNDGDETG